MNDVRVFLCFDVDHDLDLCDRLYEQSQRGSSGFTVLARSRGGAVTDRWCESARRHIRDADEVIVICGEHSHDSLRMSSELQIALEESKPYFMLWGRRERMCTMPARDTRAGCMYSWTWEILRRLVADTLRSAQPVEIPDRYKRP